jgi:ribosomal protein L29
MDVKEFRNQTPEALDKTAAEIRAKIRDLRFTVGTGSRGNVRDLRNAKRDLARVLTVKNAK